MSDERHRLSAVVTIPAYTLVAIVLYVLSTGPVLWLDHNGYISGAAADIVFTIYAPLGWLYKQYTQVKAAFDTYFNLWGLPP